MGIVERVAESHRFRVVLAMYAACLDARDLASGLEAEAVYEEAFALMTAVIDELCREERDRGGRSDRRARRGRSGGRENL